nr:hypothetical protein [Corynebacterium bovis]
MTSSTTSLASHSTVRAGSAAGAPSAYFWSTVATAAFGRMPPSDRHIARPLSRVCGTYRSAFVSFFCGSLNRHGVIISEPWIIVESTGSPLQTSTPSTVGAATSVLSVVDQNSRIRRWGQVSSSTGPGDSTPGRAADVSGGISQTGRSSVPADSRWGT